MRKNLFDISGELDATGLKASNREVAYDFSGMYGRDVRPHIYIGDWHIYMKSIDKIAFIFIHALQSGDFFAAVPRPPWTLAIYSESVGV